MLRKSYLHPLGKLVGSRQYSIPFLHNVNAKVKQATENNVRTVGLWNGPVSDSNDLSENITYKSNNFCAHPRESGSKV